MSKATSPSLPMAILAGGLATRLRPITEKIPKSLVSVAGRPFLAHQLELLRDGGITDIVLCVGHLGEMIEKEFRDGGAWGVRLRYSFDGAKLLGTGGALRQALPLLGDAFFVLYGDSYLPIDYRAVQKAFEESARAALMTVFRNEGQWDRSNVWFEDGGIRLYSKKEQCPDMRYIDYGLSVLSPSVLAKRPSDAPFDLADVLSTLSRDGDLAGFEAKRRFYEVGSHAGLEELDRLLKSGGTLPR